MEKRCYICNKILTKEDVKESEVTTHAITHGEHIIHNAILGRLVSDKILCKGCGASFSDKVDSAFTSLFAPFVSRLDAIGANRRDTNSVAKEGYLCNNNGVVSSVIAQEKDGEIYLKNQKIIEYDVDNENRKIYVYACPSRVKNYKNQLSKEYPQYSTYEFVSRDYSSRGDYIAYFFSEKNPVFNQSFKKGFVKIALEFALHVGIDRFYLSDALSIQTDGKSIVEYDSVDMIPYYPFDNREKYYEQMKWSKGNCPYHMLRLFDIEGPENKKWLVCFVDLFSTFQYYVILNKDYKGKGISEYYSHRIIPIEKNGKNVYEFSFPDYLDELCFYDSEFRKYTIDSETEQKLQTLFLCNGLCIENMDEIRKYTSGKFNELVLFLWG